MNAIRLVPVNGDGQYEVVRGDVREGVYVVRLSTGGWAVYADGPVGTAAVCDAGTNRPKGFLTKREATEQAFAIVNNGEKTS